MDGVAEQGETHYYIQVLAPAHLVETSPCAPIYHDLTVTYKQRPRSISQLSVRLFSNPCCSSLCCVDRYGIQRHAGILPLFAPASCLYLNVGICELMRAMSIPRFITRIPVVKHNPLQELRHPCQLGSTRTRGRDGGRDRGTEERDRYDTEAVLRALAMWYAFSSPFYECSSNVSHFRLAPATLTKTGPLNDTSAYVVMFYGPLPEPFDYCAAAVRDAKECVLSHLVNIDFLNRKGFGVAFISRPQKIATVPFMDLPI
ncbi:hypothetical protein Hypma_010437 [Hypsizygus marmoreus]|uniref:Uncharacterized protein n=1 Tax=Hypsizygus marmoreus TaxID=39966 RepID=A0A369K8H3_HYPMA|nr:hypothetical protein Hypma_010437 [Hypsizygus marmoreus]